MNELECPVCGEWIQLRDFQDSTTCPECQTYFLVNNDAEFSDSMWRNRSHLYAPPVSSADGDSTLSGEKKKLNP